MRSRSAGLIFTVVFAAACGSNSKGAGPRDAGGNDAGPPATDAPADVAGGGDAPVDAPVDVPAPAVSFVFTNATSRSLYIQISGFSGQAYWSLYQAGNHLPVDNTCETCDCRTCPSCAVCGRALARVKEIAPGASHSWSWDGRIWQVVPNGCSANLACEQDQVIPTGAVLDLGVTYSSSFAVDTTFGADDQFIGSPSVSTAAFTNAPGAFVAIIATQ
jgi:hypothetical protein